MPSRHLNSLRVCVVPLLALVLVACGDVWNDPHPADEQDRNFIYESFNSRPRHLDPAQSYVEDEAWYVSSIYEPLYEYHYLKRPYTLKPNLAEDMPSVHYRDAGGALLPMDAPLEAIAETEYEIHLHKGVLYQPHPALAVDEQGHPRYVTLDDKQLGPRSQIGDFEHTGTREMTAADIVYQIKRIARPGIDSPSLAIFSQIIGLNELAATLRADVAAGKLDPSGWIDLRKYPLPGVDAPDDHTLRIRIRGKFPQFIYWLAVTFIVPLPWEAERFYAQPGMAQRELTLDMWPVGTGAFMLTRNMPLRELRLERNPNHRLETYPCEGMPGDAEAGLLHDCGKQLPLLDGVVFSYEKEATPFWNKFLQGYYDYYASTRFASMTSFDNALQLQGGALSLSPEMKRHGITLRTEVEPALEYFFINMLDPVIGNAGATPEQRDSARKIRQAMAIAVNIEEYLAIIKNGLGISMQNVIPPGVPGFLDGEKGINPYAYTWANGRPKRRSLDEARQLLVEAGYPGGRNATTGEPLLVYFDGYDSFDRTRLELLVKQLARIDIQLVPRLTEWNRFQEKQRKGNGQFLFWGWNADYPDPENLLFQYYSKNGKVKYQGENATNYDVPEYDRLFEQFRGMDLTSDRQAIVDRMVDMLRRDAPVTAGWYNEAFQLSHAWIGNVKLGKLMKSGRKYLTVDVAKRNAMRPAWNRPKTGPLWVMLALTLLLAALAVRHYRRHETQRALPGDGT